MDCSIPIISPFFFFPLEMSNSLYSSVPPKHHLHSKPTTDAWRSSSLSANVALRPFLMWWMNLLIISWPFILSLLTLKHVEVAMFLTVSSARQWTLEIRELRVCVCVCGSFAIFVIVWHWVQIWYLHDYSSMIGIWVVFTWWVHGGQHYFITYKQGVWYSVTQKWGRRLSERR